MGHDPILSNVQDPTTYLDNPAQITLSLEYPFPYHWVVIKSKEANLYGCTMQVVNIKVLSSKPCLN